MKLGVSKVGFMANMLLLIISGEEERLKMPLNFAKTQIKAGNKIKVVF